MRKTFGVILALPLLLATAATWSQERTCSATDFQACKTCGQLETAIDLKNPDAGDYFRGAAWNGLYSAYVLNCPLIGTKLLKAGASPSSGGTGGSMILTVSSKWPHDQRKINEAWAALLLGAGAEANNRLPYAEGKTTTEVLKESGGGAPDYFDIFMLFQK